MQPDGKIVLAGTCRDNVSNEYFCVARLNTDGSPEPTFIGPSGTGIGKFLVPVGSNGLGKATAMALQPNGKIILAGYCSNGANYEDFCAVRLNGDGSFEALAKLFLTLDAP